MSQVKPLKVATDGTLAQVGTTDTILPANLATGIRNGTQFLRDDGAWATPLGVSTSSPYRLTVYYGTPAGVNGLWDSAAAGQLFSNSDLIVFGDGLEIPTEPNYATTTATLSTIKSYNPIAVIFGYIDLGVTTQNLSLTQIQTKVDQWITAGATGIFFDDAGYDFQVSRARMNSAIDYVHGKNLPTMINAWISDDVFASTVNATYNPTGVATSLSVNDYYLLESWIVNTAAYATDSYATFYDIKTRGDAAVAYRATYGTKIVTTNVADFSTYTDSQLHGFFRMCEVASLTYSLDGYGLCPTSYSASAPNSNAFNLFRYRDDYVSRKHTPVQYSLNGAWTEFQRPSVGTIFHREAGQNWCQYRVGDVDNLQVTLDFGAIPVASKSFKITLPVGSPSGRISMTASAKPVAGRSMDELEMDNFACATNCSIGGTLNAFISAIPGPVMGSYNFNIILG